MKRRTAIGSRLVGAALLSLATTAANEAAANDESRIAAIVDKAIEPAMKEHGVPGMAKAAEPRR